MAALFRRSRPICQSQRAFSTSTPKNVSLQWDRNDPEALAEVLPPYPHGPPQWYQQSRLGLYGGQRIQFGNNVSEKFKTKTRRTWQPNIFTRKLFSVALERHVQVRVSARVLRTIDKLGGLDEYLLGEKEARIKELGESGWWLRWAIMQSPVLKKRFRAERERLGMPAAREELEAIIEAMTPAEEKALMDETEAVAMDDTFKLQQSEDFNPIKFRVGRGQHVMLTANGWRRTKPDYSRSRKAEIEKKYFPSFVKNKVKAYAAQLRQKLAAKKLEVEEGRLRQLMVHARTKFRKELQEKIDKQYELETMVMKKLRNRETRKEFKKRRGRKISEARQMSKGE